MLIGITSHALTNKQTVGFWLGRIGIDTEVL